MQQPLVMQPDRDAARTDPMLSLPSFDATASDEAGDATMFDPLAAMDTVFDDRPLAERGFDVDEALGREAELNVDLAQESDTDPSDASPADVDASDAGRSGLGNGVKLVSCGVVVAALALNTACATSTAAAPGATAQPEAEPTPSASAGALELQGTPVRFLDRAEASAFLGSEDAFTRGLSAFDRQLRLRSTDPVDDATYRAHNAAAAVDWSDAGREAWTQTVAEVNAALAGLDLPLPDEVLLVRTNGSDEFGAAYTRGGAIILPLRESLLDERQRFGLLAHELFHVASRAGAGEARDRLYGLLGFVPTADRAWPAALDAQRITNPDGLDLGHALKVTHGVAQIEVTPVLVSRAPIEEALAAKPFIKILQIVLLQPSPEGGWLEEDGAPVTVDVSETDFIQRLSINTDSVIHPDEALADNFALLARRRAGQAIEVKDPSFLDRLEAALIADAS